MSSRGWSPSLNGLTAFCLYSLLSLLLTWPLVLGLGRDVPGDLGDSLLNMWILAWGAEHVPRLLSGGISWSDFWNANIFHPDPLALALSEHLFGQTLQILPVYWLTGNIILCYNLLFVSTFALSAFGTYLLVRDLTGSKRAAFLAGLVYGFLPYRIASVPHLQVMSSQWMPFALWGLNRFITLSAAPGSPPTRPEGSSGETSPELASRAKAGRVPALRALALGTGALVMQNWSCGYYLLYFAPFVPLFVLHRMWSLGTLRRVHTWALLSGAAAGTVILTVPFLFPYRHAQQLFAIERPFAEVVGFSANVWSYITASENVRLWGAALRFYPHGEGETFLGFVPWILAVVALIVVIRRTRSSLPNPSNVSMRWNLLTWFLLAAAISQFIAVASVIIFGGFDVNLFGIPIRARTVQRLLLQFVVATGLLLAAAPRMRDRAAGLARSPEAFFLGATVLAMWLSLGPLPKAGGSLVSGFGLYGVFYEYVPGFNGVRVPARYAMLAGLFLAALAGYGARVAAVNVAALTVAGALILAEGAAIPMETNRTWNQNEATPPSRVMPHAEAPPVYARLASLPKGTVVTEFPFGDAAWEIRYVYYAAAHWHPITNGYSGAFPPRYKERVARLQRVAADPAAAWQALRASGTTHVVLHRNAFARPEDADAVESWLDASGAIELERFPDEDILFALAPDS